MKRKIAFISEHASPLATLGGVDSGGQNVYVAETAKHLAELGYHIDIYTRWEDSSIARIVNWKPGIRVIHVKAGPVDIVPKEDLLTYMPDFRDDMIRFIQSRKLHYLLVHANFYMSAWVAAELKTALGIPFVVTFHALGQVRKIYQGKDDKFPEERISIERKVVQTADAIIAECPQDRADLIKYYKAPADKISIVPCGFSQEEFFPIDKLAARKELNLDPKEKILLQLGRMVPRKGVDNVVKAMSRLKKAGMKIRLLIVGGEADEHEIRNTPEIKRLEAIASAEGVLDWITFAGRKSRDVLKYYYSAADVFITTPWYEPFGITPLEAMACGTPVIGSNVGGIKYSVADGKTGFLVPPQDPDAVAEKAIRLISDPILLKSMKKNAINRVNNLFTWSQVSYMLSNLYEDVLELVSPLSFKKSMTGGKSQVA
jgi:D-inositol-3-phosphate glycosyltransferase